MSRILLIDDDPLLTRNFARLLLRHGYEVRVVNDAAEALDAASECKPDVIVLDLHMPGRDGLELLPELKARCPDGEVIVYTGTGNIKKAVLAIKCGAYNFIEKSDQEDEVLLGLELALEHRRLHNENALLRQAYTSRVGPDSFLCFSDKTREVVALADRYRRTPGVSVLIEGESGTGKELIARYIHSDPEDRASPFVPINCGAIPHELVESELFGHVPGAFTGARAEGAPGKIQAADGGTLFLDEIGDLDLGSQVKFLRFLEHATFYPVGGHEEKHVDVRVVCATNCRLEDAMANHTFRRDLYYRIHVGHIRIPPLRERPEEIIPFAYHFLHEFSQRFSNLFEEIHPSAEEILRHAPWHGNVRELRHAIERIVLVEEGKTLLPQHVAFLIQGASRPGDGSPPAALPGPAEALLPEDGLDLEAVMLRLIERAMDKHEHNQSRTARYLNITREALRYRMRKLRSPGPPAASTEAPGV